MSAMIRRLAPYDDYTRRDVHDIFSPETAFTPQAGLWGISGLIGLPGRPGDFAFLVTYGQKQGEHNFDEGISSEGVLRWQSQPHQRLGDRVIQTLIAHQADTNSIYLFLRAADRRHGQIAPYTYFGRLRYDGHDRERERPVHFRWQLLDWPIPAELHGRVGLMLEDEEAGANSFDQSSTLTEEEPPRPSAPGGGTTDDFRARRLRRPPERETRALGLAGEILVVQHEHQRLMAAGRPDLASVIIHTSVIEGDGAGFDIRSFFADGRPMFIEVKTTTGPKDTDFIVTANEVAFSQAHQEDYTLMRLFSFDASTNSSKFYRVCGGDLTSMFQLQPIQFRARRV
jgi:hypothetical protein